MKTDNYTFLDTCSLLDSCWDVRGDSSRPNLSKERHFWNVELPKLMSGSRIILPLRNYEELQKHAVNTGRPDLANRSKSVLARIDALVKSGGIEIVGDQNDPFADAILLSVALKFRTQRNMVFITQDRALANDLNSVAQFQSVQPRKGFRLKVMRIDKSGALREFDGPQSQSQTTQQSIDNTAAQTVRKKHWWEV